MMPVVVGKNADGDTISFDLSKLPHLLIGGAVGQGKTRFLHGLINGLITSCSPEEVRLILFDQSGAEFVAYENLPHLAVPVLNKGSRVALVLHWAVAEMEKRLKLFARVQVRNIHEYNNREIADDELLVDIPERIPYLVIVLDEIEEVMRRFGSEVVPDIARLTAKAREAGIHLVLATQHLTSNVIIGTIKVNILGRIAFKTANARESRFLVGDSGAENLNAKGDCLCKDNDGILHQVKVPFISDDEIAVNVEQVIARYSKMDYDFKIPKAVMRKIISF